MTHPMVEEVTVFVPEHMAPSRLRVLFDWPAVLKPETHAEQNAAAVRINELKGGIVMYCSHCGVQVAGHASFCPSCGGAQPGNVSSKQLVRPIQGRKMGGVCLALANYMNLDVTLVRGIWLLLALLPVPGPFVLA